MVSRCIDWVIGLNFHKTAFIVCQFINLITLLFILSDFIVWTILAFKDMGIRKTQFLRRKIGLDSMNWSKNWFGFDELVEKLV